MEGLQIILGKVSKVELIRRHDTMCVKVFCSVGNLIVCTGLMLNIAASPFTLETGYRSVVSLARPLQDQILTNRVDKTLTKNMIKELSDLKPLTGNGYFSITKATLTSMFSVGITYIIILAQFKISASKYVIYSRSIRLQD